MCLESLWESDLRVSVGRLLGDMGAWLIFVGGGCSVWGVLCAVHTHGGM